jgi:Holliday junction resolvase RusA-like endonuclease
VGTKIIRLEIPMLAPSVNQYWVQSRHGGRFITPKGVEFKKLCREAFIKDAITVPSEWANLSLNVRMELRSPNWFKKKGGINLRRGDLDNFGKSTIDSLFHCLEPLDDAQIFSLNMSKVVVDKDQPESTLVEISVLNALQR